MRFKSDIVDGYQIFAVSGVNAVSFGIDGARADTTGLLGFAVERVDPTENERYFMYGFKVFASVLPKPDDTTSVTTFDHPVQSFVWDDFTAKDGRPYEYIFYPIKGRPKNLDRSARGISIKIRTELKYSDSEHDIFFNRGVASSQAYAREFDNERPDKMTPEKRARAFQWLGRGLDDAIVKFIGNAKSGDSLLCCFYEFRYEPVATALKAALKDRGVDVKIIFDAKVNETTDKKGIHHPSFPREDNLNLVKTVKIPKANIILREARKSAIAHNKFMVLLKGGTEPQEVWTGSTNISEGGIFGQTNVGHWIRNRDIAEKYRQYWELLAEDPGGAADDNPATVRRKNAEFKAKVAEMTPAPADWHAFATGVTPLFSPRPDDSVLKMYAAMNDQAERLSCITLAFGISADIKKLLEDNTPKDHLAFFLLEKEDKPNSRSTQPFVVLNSKNNVYEAWGSYLSDPFNRWAKETNAGSLGLNQHVSYVHSKFLLVDPMSAAPIVVTGSANFSTDSTKENDENMVVIRGNMRAADIYFTEFNRLFNHYYFRSVHESLERSGHADDGNSLFLVENDSWLSKYKPGTLRSKRLAIFTGMAGIAP